MGIEERVGRTISEGKLLGGVTILKVLKRIEPGRRKTGMPNNPAAVSTLLLTSLRS
jgi:transposase